MPTDDADRERLLAELTLEERVGLLAGTDLWHLPAIPRIGLAALKMTDGPNGARGERSTGGPPSALFPCGTMLAATFDTALVGRVGQALGAEAKAKGAHVLLAPTVNLHRSPLGGRDFECYSEDPYLSARMAVAYVNGVQSTGVAACVKHLVANDAEYERFTCSSDVSERTLRELYLVPFEAALLEAGAWAVMSAYNRLNGTHCSQHPDLLTGLLRDEWGWDGTVVSDWWGSHTTV
jgi:beta-glucosidase